MSYIVLALTSILALIALAKDWKAHSTDLRRIGALVVILACWAGGSWNVYLTSRQNERDKGALNDKIQGLQGDVKGLNAVIKAGQDQTRETGKAFSDSISHLSDKVADLQTRVQTSDLKKEAADLRKELTRTNKD
jgi:hypothetical protein